MTDFALRFIKELRNPARLTEGWNTLQGARKPSLVVRIENAFVAWQAARLQSLPPERLWAPAMQDTRSFAEIRRTRAAAQR